MFHVEHDREIKELLSRGAKAVGCPLLTEQIEKLFIYFNELCSWNKRVNLTGLKKETDIVVTLFIDSLACGLALNIEKNEKIIDIGSGAGFPGIPLKIAYPKLKIDLVEPRLKKTAFLHHIIGVLGLENIKALSRSAQDLSHDPSFTRVYDKVVSRAIKAESIFPVSCALLNSSGKAVLCRSKRLGSTGPGPGLGMSLVEEIDYELPHGYGSRVLSVLTPLKKNSH